MRAEARQSTSQQDFTAVLAWLRSQRPGPVLYLVCADHPAPASATSDPDSVVIRAPGCLADLPRSTVPELLVDGAQVVHLVVRTQACREALLDRVGDVLSLCAGAARPQRVVVVQGSALGEPELAAPQPVTEGPSSVVFGGSTRLRGRRMPQVLDARSMPVPRRILLGLESESGTAMKGQLTPHRRLLIALERLFGRDAPAADSVPTARMRPPMEPPADVLGPGLLLRAVGCTACNLCVRQCPEGALTMAVQDDVSILNQRPRACSGGGKCIDVCPVDALTVRRPARWVEQLGGDRVLPLATIPTATCDRCGATMPDQGRPLCDVCTFHRTDPFRSYVPPAAAQLLATYESRRRSDAGRR